jgi:outer membrane receptor for Fe3+-dicitrate
LLLLAVVGYLGFKVSKNEFLNNPQLQEEAMMALLLHNKEKLQLYIDTFDGKTINGMLVTESGILAAAHLGGQGSVKRYFKNGKVFKDGNGTKITSYMNKFSGYEIKLKPNS